MSLFQARAPHRFQAKAPLFSSPFIWLFFLALILAPRASAQIAANAPQILSGVGLDEKLGEQLPLDLSFLSHDGQPVTLGDIAKEGKPILLNPLYYECPILCNLVIDGVANSMEMLDWIPGDEFVIVSFTVDMTEGPAEASKTRDRILKQLSTAPNTTPGRMELIEKGWYFLSDDPGTTNPDVHSDEPSKTGSAAILADAIGFRYKPEPITGEIIHPAAVAFISNRENTLTITRYLYGFNFDPFELKNALFEAADGRIGRTIEQALLYCYTYDPNSRSYVPLAWNIMKLGGLVTAGFLGIFLTVLWLRSKRSVAGA